MLTFLTLVLSVTAMNAQQRQEMKSETVAVTPDGLLQPPGAFVEQGFARSRKAAQTVDFADSREKQESSVDLDSISSEIERSETGKVTNDLVMDKTNYENNQAKDLLDKAEDISAVITDTDDLNSQNANKNAEVEKATKTVAKNEKMITHDFKGLQEMAKQLNAGKAVLSDETSASGKSAEDLSSTGLAEQQDMANIDNEVNQLQAKLSAMTSVLDADLNTLVTGAERLHISAFLFTDSINTIGYYITELAHNLTRCEQSFQNQASAVMDLLEEVAKQDAKEPVA